MRESEEYQKIILQLGQKRFGPPPEVVTDVLQSIEDLDQLEQLVEKLLVVSSWQELLDLP
jgi:hypothetical protein